MGHQTNEIRNNQLQKFQLNQINSGAGIEYIRNKFRANFNYAFGSGGSVIGYNFNVQNLSGGSYAGAELIFSLDAGYELNKKISLIRLPKVKYNGQAFVLENLEKYSNRYLLNFKIIPFVGFKASKISDKSFQGESISFNIGSNNSFYTSIDYEFFIPYKIYDKPIIRRDNNLYLSLGTTLQFFSYKKDRLAIHFEYRKGFFAYLDTFILYRKIGETDWQSKRLYSRGSCFSITASYPITILNKKGERYRDRHPKL
jgi:hypothetical protein